MINNDGFEPIYSYDYDSTNKWGVAEIKGKPFYFVGEKNGNWFNLRPIDNNALTLAKENEVLILRYAESRMHELLEEVTAKVECHPNDDISRLIPYLPEDRERGIELMKELEEVFFLNDKNTMQASAQFRYIDEKRWTDVSGTIYVGPIEAKWED